MKKKKSYRLTNLELELMQLLWEADKPLSRAEIMDIVDSAPGKPLFSSNSFHLLVNDLMEKDLIISVAPAADGRKNARRFAPNISRNEYFALQISTTENYKADDIPDIFAALFKVSQDNYSETVLDKMEQLIRQKRG